MAETTLLCNGVVVTSLGEPTIVSGGAVVWKGDRVEAVGRESEIVRRFPEARRIDARGGLILPGLVNAHHHFYSSLARGLDPGVTMRTFPEILDGLWWRLDRALDEESVLVSALLATCDCIRSGCTTVFDHHASPSVLSGSLDLVAGAVEQAGLSAVLCYEASDRNGHAEALAGIGESLRFARDRRGDPRVRGMLGLHASFTLRDETLARAAELRAPEDGCHIHVAEDPSDVVASREAFGAGPVARLESFGLLDDRAILVHGLHLGEDDYRRIADRGATLVHNPESNANNGVGRLEVEDVASLGCAVALGTDGMSSSMLGSLRAAFLALRGGRQDPTAGFAAVPGLLPTNVRLARLFFDEPLLGELSEGAPADLIVVDAPPPTALGPDNLFGHLVYGASLAPVRHTVARGRVLLEDFRLTTLDPEELAARAREASKGLWRRFSEMQGGTTFLGD